MRHLTRALTLLVMLVTSATAHAAPAPDRPETPPQAAVPADANVEAVVLRALAAGMSGSFDKYLEELAAERRETSDQRSQLQRYEFKRFSAQAAWYVGDPQKPTIQVVRRDPQGDKKIKLFIKDLVHKDAMPRPIELVRVGDRWWISSNSL